MHLTRRLCKQHLGWHLKRLWKIKKERSEPILKVASILQDKEIIDPLVAWKPVKERWTPPVEDPAWRDPHVILNKEELSTDWNEEQTYVMLPHIELMEGLKQASILCKCQLHEGLPPSVSQLVTEEPLIPDQDLLVQRIILQSQKWDPTVEKLPRRIVPDKPDYTFARERGIPAERSKEIFVRGLVRLCDTMYSKYPRILDNRRDSGKPFISTNYTHLHDKRIVIQGELNRLITSDTPLPLFADDDAIDETVTYKLPDMWPVAPTIDLSLQNLYTTKHSSGFTHNYAHGHPHTLFLAAQDADVPQGRWATNPHVSHGQSAATALMFCLGASLAQARKLYGDDVGTLPQPISVQCVNTTSSVFNFVFFQLNTLNFSSSDGVKNSAWVDVDNALYRRVLPRRWSSGDIRDIAFDSYDAGVFRKFVAVYLNGAVE